MDDVYIAALETELAHAKHVAPGGQPSNPTRVAAIEDELHRARGGGKRRRPQLETTVRDDTAETTEGPRAR